MPGLNVRNNVRVHSRGRWFGEGDSSGGTVKDIETSSCRVSISNNDFVGFIRDPAVLRAKGHETVAIAGERRYRDKARAAGGNEKNISE